MHYFIDKSGMVMGFDEGTNEMSVLTEIKVIDEKKASIKIMKPARKERNHNTADLSDLDDQPKNGRRSRLMPEVLKTIKERLGAGIPVAAIHDETGVSAPTIYLVKKQLGL